MLARNLTLAVALGVLAAPAGASAEEPSAVAPGHVPEPAGLYQGAMHGYTPNTITGGKVVDTVGLSRLIDKGQPLLLDVAEKDRKPPSMGKDTPWFPIHRTIPGAVFLQGAGSGTGDAAFETAFKTRVATLANNDKAKVIVTFCHPDCWGSYNAAKRLIDLGYSHVYWYRDGVEGWQADHDTRSVKPDPAWVQALPKAMTE